MCVRAPPIDVCVLMRYMGAMCSYWFLNGSTRHAIAPARGLRPRPWDRPLNASQVQFQVGSTSVDRTSTDLRRYLSASTRDIHAQNKEIHPCHGRNVPCLRPHEKLVVSAYKLTESAKKTSPMWKANKILRFQKVLGTPGSGQRVSNQHPPRRAGSP